MSDKVQQFNMLQEVVTHFSKNPRSLRSYQDGSCLYSRPTNKPKSLGCGIGIFLNDKVAKKLDKISTDTGIDNIMGVYSELLPKWMQKMDVDFLSAIQGLHDSDSNWNDYNISKSGIEDVKDICKQFDLDFSKIKFKKVK